MSTHSRLDGCDRDEHDRVFWQGRCECGWEGEPHTGSGTYDKAHADYRRHICDTLGGMAFYTAPVACLNCAYAGPAEILVGTDVWSGTCPVCGARGRLRPHNDFYTEERESRVRW